VGRFALVVALCVALLAACVKPISPARTYDDYEKKAKNTAEAVLSSVQTARLAARAAGDGDSFGPFTSVVLSEAEDGASHAQEVFDSIQPPDSHADRLRAQLGKLLTKASDGLASLRIASRRGELDRLTRLARPLRTLAERLDAFTTRHH
jgi:hypothetical protein